MEQNQKKSDSGLIIRASVEISQESTNKLIQGVNELTHGLKDVIRGVSPWLIYLVVLPVLTSVGFKLLPNYLNGPEPSVPLPTEVQK